MERTTRFIAHFSSEQRGYGIIANPTSTTMSSDGPDDVVIIAALRTPICKSGRGGFKDTLPDDMLATVLDAVVKQAGLRKDEIQDICIGNVNQPGAGAVVARIAQFMCGYPESVPTSTVNRFCASGLQACMNIAGSIKAGVIDVGIGGGVESMTVNPMRTGLPHGFILNPKVGENQLAQDSLLPMGITSENVAAKFNISRRTQDEFAVLSHEKAARAQKNGWFTNEIVPVKTVMKDKEDHERPVTISEDDGIRPGTNLETLSKLKPAFKEGGSTTAGNASQTSDGAAAVIFARRSFAKARGLPILGVVKSYAVVGVPPDIMGVGPAYAIPEAVKKAGLTYNDIDVFEINEAFASQATYCVKKLDIPIEKVNPKGGAIALGHPLGCTGARQIATLLHELKRRGKRANGVVSMCMGTGMGAACVIEYPGN